MAGKKDLEKEGRKGDKVLAHLTPGEIVIPRAFAEDEDLRKMLSVLFRANGASLQQFMVGGTKNKINPKTGYPEFFFGIGAAILGIGSLFGGIGSTIAGAFAGGGFLSSVSAVALGMAGGSLLSSLISGGPKDIKMPPPVQKKATAPPTVQLSEQAKRNRRLAASALTKGFAEPTLGTPALLGASGMLGV